MIHTGYLGGETKAAYRTLISLKLFRKRLEIGVWPRIHPIVLSGFHVQVLWAQWARQPWSLPFLILYRDHNRVWSLLAWECHSSPGRQSSREEVKWYLR